MKLGKLLALNIPNLSSNYYPVKKLFSSRCSNCVFLISEPYSQPMMFLGEGLPILWMLNKGKDCQSFRCLIGVIQIMLWNGSSSRAPIKLLRAEGRVLRFNGGGHNCRFRLHPVGSLCGKGGETVY